MMKMINTVIMMMIMIMMTIEITIMRTMMITSEIGVRREVLATAGGFPPLVRPAYPTV